MSLFNIQRDKNIKEPSSSGLQSLHILRALNDPDPNLNSIGFNGRNGDLSYSRLGHHNLTLISEEGEVDPQRF